jgi:hypothetical protein
MHAYWSSADCQGGEARAMIAIAGFAYRLLGRAAL